MRALSSMFGARRSEKPTSTSTSNNSASQSNPPLPEPKKPSQKPSRIFGTISRKHAPNKTQPKQDDIPPLPLNSPPPFPSSSSASSSGSHSLQTPGDDEGLLRSSSKASWMSWLGHKKSAVSVKPSMRGGEWEIPRQEWNSRPPPVLRPPLPRPQPIDETDDESPDEEEDESETSSITVPTIARSVTPSALATSRQNVRSMLKSSLQPPFSPPPLLHVPGQSLFPRSCNRRSLLHMQESTESRMHKTRLFARLNGSQLARSEEIELIVFSTRTPVAKRVSLQLDDQFPPSTSHVRSYSQGLQTWALRPCFEDRFVVWKSDTGTGTVSCERVSGTDLGVAALEISEALDALAGAIVDEVEVDVPTTSDSTSSLLLPPVSSLIRSSPVSQSPLRTENNTPLLPSAIRSAVPTASGIASVPTVRRGVRFADDDKDDQIPLGYVLRIKKKREEKARFLREEKARQASLEEERAAERRRHDLERMQWEKERRQWEAEKKAMEEERRKQKYAEEVIATRQRREASRSGFYVPTPAQGGATRPQLSESRSTDRNSSYLHPERQASEAGPGSGSPYSASPTSSNPPSVNGSGFFSRPESTGSVNTTLSSMEDIRQKKNASKRASIVDQPQQPMIAVPYFPMWGNPYAVPAVPVMPAMPFYTNLDMPLLPPTPPFMMQQSRRSQSSNSPSHSRSSSPRHRTSGSPHNGSSDRLSVSQRSTTSSRPDAHQHHRTQSSENVGRPSQKLAASGLRSGSSTDVRGRQSTVYANTASQLSTPPPGSLSTSSRSQTQWGLASLSRDARGRPSASRRQTAIN